VLTKRAHIFSVNKIYLDRFDLGDFTVNALHEYSNSRSVRAPFQNPAQMHQ